MPNNTQELGREIEQSEIWKDPELSWHKFQGIIHPPVLAEDINGFGKWLFLKGFRDPDLNHESFDFSAYRTITGEKMLGLPEGTPVYSPLNGKVEIAEEFGVSANSIFEVYYYNRYHGKVSIRHNCTGTISTTFVHIIPSVELGDYVKMGQSVGTVYATPGKKEGKLIHVDVAMHEMWHKIYNCRISGHIDPLKVIFKKDFQEGNYLERLTLPHSGPYTKSELARKGIHVRYKKLEYIQPYT